MLRRCRPVATAHCKVTENHLWALQHRIMMKLNINTHKLCGKSVPVSSGIVHTVSSFRGGLFLQRQVVPVNRGQGGLRRDFAENVSATRYNYAPIVFIKYNIWQNCYDEFFSRELDWCSFFFFWRHQCWISQANTNHLQAVAQRMFAKYFSQSPSYQRIPPFSLTPQVCAARYAERRVPKISFGYDLTLSGSSWVNFIHADRIIKKAV